MKKYVTLIMLLLFSCFIFSYVYISGENVIGVGDEINIYGYNLDRAFMKVFKINNPENILIHEKNILNENKRLIFQKIIRSQNNQINDSFSFKEKGLYLISFEDENANIISYENVLVSDLEMISAYNQERLFLKFYEKSSMQSINCEKVYVMDLNDNLITFNNLSELNIENMPLKKVIIKNNNDYAFLNYNYYHSYTVFKNKSIQFFSDKPIYKPNQEMFYKINSFKKMGNHYDLNLNQEISLKIYDPAGNIVENKIVKTGDLGGYDNSFFISPSAPLGYYRIEIKYTDENDIFYYGFIVQEYVKPEYTVELFSSSEKYNSGDIIDFKAEVKYFNNTPVKKAKISYYIYYAPFSSGYYDRGNLIYRGISFTNEDGLMNIPIKSQENHNGRYTIEIITVDESQRQLEFSYDVSVYSGDYIISTENDYYSLPLNEEFSIKGNVDYVNNPDKKVSGEGEIYIYNYSNELIYNTEINVLNGEWIFEGIIENEGSYILNVYFEESDLTFYVYAGSYFKNVFVENIRLIDDTLFFRLRMLQDMQGVLFLAGEDFYDFVEYNSNISEYSFKIPKDIIEKNIFIQGLFFNKNKREWINERVDLKNSDSFIYNYVISTDKNEYSPGDIVELTIDSESDGIFSLSVVDKAIYELIGHERDYTEDVYPQLYSPEVSFSFSDKYFRVNYYANIQVDEMHTFASYKGSSQTKTNTREIFTDTAFWLPTLKTENNKATVSFKLPDNLTTWRINALAFSEGKVNFTRDEIVSNLDYYVRPLLPSFSRKGENIFFDVVVYNNSKEDIKYNYYVEVDSEGLNIKNHMGEIALSPFESKIVNLELEANEIGIYSIKFDFEKDIVILPFEVKDTKITLEILSLYNSDSNPVEIKKGELYRPFDIKKIIQDNIDYLIQYPYGCSEQTISTVYPLVIASKNGYHVEDLDKLVINSVQRLIVQQNIYGGWGWWQNDASSIQLTSYVLEGLWHIKDSGYFVPDDMIKLAIEYLLQNDLTGYSYYVLKKYDVQNISYKPKSDTDILYMSFYDEENYEKMLSMILTDNDLSKLKISIDGYFFGEIEYNFLALNSILKRDTKNDKILNLFRYLLNNRYGRRWYSTKDSARMLELMLNFENLLNIGTSELKHDFVEAENDLLIKDSGLYEVIRIVSVEERENISTVLEKEYFKRYEVDIYDFDNKFLALADIFINIEDDFFVNSIKTKEVENNLLITDSYKLWVNDNKNDYWIIDSDNLKIRKTDFRVFINDADYDYVQKIIIKNDFVYISKYNEFIVLNLRNNITQKTQFQELIDFTVSENGYIVMFNNNNKTSLFFSNGKTVNIMNGFRILDYYDGKIILADEKSYVLNLDAMTYEELFPFKATKILEINDNKIKTFGLLNFEGNRKNVSEEPLLFEFSYSRKENNIVNGDILKTRIKFQTSIDGYFTIEDYIPGNIQILNNYNEKNVASTNKFYSYWYQPWDYWYSSFEVKRDTVAFFSHGFSSGVFDYYFRVTHAGEIYFMPSIGFNMYYQGNYGISDSRIFNIEK